MDGSAVDGAIRAGKLDEVRRYCETDVLNTYLVYQRFRLLRGEIEPAEYASEISHCARADRGDSGAPLGGVHRRLGRERYALTNGTGAKRPPTIGSDGRPHQRSSTVA